MQHRYFQHMLYKQDEPNAQSTPDTNTDDASNKNGSTPDTSQGEDNKTEGETEPTLTQTEVDRIMARTRKEGRESAKAEILKELGIDDIESAKTLFADAKQRKEQEMSDVEKALQQADKEKQEKEALQKEIADMKALQLANKRETTLKDAMRDAGANDVNRLHILVQAEQQDLLADLFDENAVADDKAMEKFIKQIQSDYANYFASGGAGNPDTNNGVAPEIKKQQREQARKAMLRNFRQDI